MVNEHLVIEIKKRLKRPIVLTGLMGVGKTRIGQLLAKTLGVPFYDSDDEIVVAAGYSIPEIFERFGESYFRDGERRVLKRLLENELCVVATGGGAVMNEETAEIIYSRSVCAWIKAELDIMVERTGRNENRPLLQQGDPADILRKLMDERYPVYEKADIVIESHDGKIKDVLDSALENLDAYLSQRTQR